MAPVARGFVSLCVRPFRVVSRLLFGQTRDAGGLDGVAEVDDCESEPLFYKPVDEWLEGGLL